MSNRIEEIRTERMLFLHLTSFLDLSFLKECNWNIEKGLYFHGDKINLLQLHY